MIIYHNFIILDEELKNICLSIGVMYTVFTIYMHLIYI